MPAVWRVGLARVGQDLGGYTRLVRAVRSSVWSGVDLIVSEGSASMGDAVPLPVVRRLCCVVYHLVAGVSVCV